MTSRSGRVRVGVSGWSYPHWRGDFYPTGLPHRRELAYAAARMTTVELNGSFYSLQRPSSYATWAAQVPAGVEIAVKGGRFITHLKKLAGVEVALANFFASGVLALGDRLGPVLWQLPETLVFDPDRVAAFLALLPRDTAAAARLAERHDDKLPEDRALSATEVDRPVRHAVEPRHPSWGGPPALALLREHGVACVAADSAGRWPALLEDTADFRYVRLHGHTDLYASRYAGTTLDRWAGRCREWAATGQDVYVYFDNDARGHAPHDAIALLGRLG